MKEMIKNTVIMVVITVVAGLLLGGTYGLTKDTIAAREQQTIMEAYKAVFPEADTFNELEVTITEEQKQELSKLGVNNSDIDTVNEAMGSNGDLLGYVISVVAHGGYGGDISFTVGITNDATVLGVKLLSISETPGLGMNAEKVLIPQFTGKNAGFFQYVKQKAAADNEIEAISGATITTKAVTDGVNLAVAFFSNYLMGGAK